MQPSVPEDSKRLTASLLHGTFLAWNFANPEVGSFALNNGFTFHGDCVGALVEHWQKQTDGALANGLAGTLPQLRPKTDL